MLTQLFTSKTRIRLLLKLFLNPGVSSYLRELAEEFSVSPASVKDELDRLSGAGYLEKKKQGRSMLYRANPEHPLFPEISSIVRKYLGIDSLVEKLMDNLGEIEAVYLLDDYARGCDSGIIDVLVVGEVDAVKLEGARRGIEKKIKRKIRVMVVSAEEYRQDKDIFLKRPHWKVA